MTTSPIAAAKRTAERPDEPIRRYVLGFMGAYRISHEQFAAALGMNLRTLERRLSGSARGGTFTAVEVGAIASLVSRLQRRPVSIDDVYGARVDASVNLSEDEWGRQVTVRFTGPEIATQTANPDTSTPARGHLRIVRASRPHDELTVKS